MNVYPKTKMMNRKQSSVPAQRRMTEAALERPFYLLWQEAARRQTGPAICIPSLSHILRQPSPPEGLFLLSFHTCRPLHAIHSAKRIPVGRNPSLLFATVRLQGAHSPRWPFGKTMHDTSERR